MSDDKQKRTVDIVRDEYARLCTKAGHCQYQIHAFTKDLEMINSQLMDLNLEAAKLSKEEAEQAKAVEEVKKDA